MHSAEIIAVGSEMLTPYRVDTNSLFLTARLNDLGIHLRAKLVVGDDQAALGHAMIAALSRADLVIVTGGLGPTADDVTREAVAEALGRPLEEDAALLESLRARFATLRRPLTENNRRQAQVPQGAQALANPNGSAPGLWIDHGSSAVVLLPGPPRELEPLFDAEVVPRLLARTGTRRLRRRVLKLTGRPESMVDQVAEPVYGPLRAAPVPIETSILAAPGQIELHLSSSGDDIEAVDRALESAVRALAAALDPYVFSVDGRSLEEVVGRLLHARGWRIAVAESCTGGLVLARLTDVSGSSAWVEGGVIAYANAVKTQHLGVPADLIAAHGAVSEPVAEAMAAGVRERLGADVGLAITGIAGPTGGTPEKPVGTVVIALAGPEMAVRTLRLPGDRETVRRHAVAAALDLVRRSLER